MAMWRAASMVKAWKKASTVIDEAAFHQFTSKVRLSNTFHPLYPVSPQPSTQLPPQVIRGSPFMLMGKRDCGLVQLPTGQIVTRSTDRLIPKRLYSSLKSPCHGKMSPGSLNLFMPRRNISFQWMGRGKGGVIPTGAFATVFQKMKKSLNTKHHLKSCGFKAWTKFSEFLVSMIRQSPWALGLCSSWHIHSSPVQLQRLNLSSSRWNLLMVRQLMATLPGRLEGWPCTPFCSLSLH